MLQYIRSFAKRRAIRSYARRLPRVLAKNYGFSKTYTPQQVRKTVERLKLNAKHSDYAVAMFSDRDDFNHYQRETGTDYKYDSMRVEVADWYFAGDVDFTVSDILDTFSDAGAGSSYAGEGYSGGDNGHNH